VNEDSKPIINGCILIHLFQVDLLLHIA